MGVLAMLEGSFGEWRESRRFERAWEDMRARHANLAVFESPEELRDFCQDSKVGYEEQDPIILTLCLEAREEAQSRSPDRFATQLLYWVFAPALWRVVEQAGRATDLDLDALQAEVIEGFLEKAFNDRSSPEGLSGALVNSARHQVWRTIRNEARESHEDLRTVEEAAQTDLPDPEWADPWLLLCYARLQGQINELDAELLFSTNLQEESIATVAEPLGLSYEAAKARIKRAKRDLAQWLGQLGEEFPPRDPNIAREIRNLAQKPSDLAQIVGRKRAPERPLNVLVRVRAPKG